jgi:transposase-like protein
MPAFAPPYCPSAVCPARSGSAAFLWRRAGSYVRAADGRRVPRFLCRACGLRFSAQSFRLDFRQRKPWLNVPVLHCLVSKVTHRQTARTLRCDRKTVHRRLSLYARALDDLHRFFLRRARRQGGLRGAFSLDELETFEQNRRLKPVTLPVLIHRDTRFVVHLEAGALPSRGRLSAADEAKKRLMGPRRSESSQMVDRCLAKQKEVHHRTDGLQLITDGKRTYGALARRHFDNRWSHARVPSEAPRGVSSPMFPINHTLASLRDNVSRLVRRSWGASQLKENLTKHARVWLAWRNYARPITNARPRASAATALGLAARRLSAADLLRWRWPLLLPPNAFAGAGAAAALRHSCAIGRGQYP